MTPEFRLEYRCPTSFVTTEPGTLYFRNGAAGDVDLVWDSNGNIYATRLDETVDFYSLVARPDASHSSMGVTGASFSSTADVYSYHRAGDFKCHAVAQAVTTRWAVAKRARYLRYAHEAPRQILCPARRRKIFSGPSKNTQCE